MDDALPPLIEVTGLSRSFRTGRTVTRSLTTVTFTVTRGEFVAIAGTSGAGKSTLLNLLGLLDVPTEGSYRLDGVEVSGLTERDRDRIRNEKIGFIFQDSHMLVDETAAENVTLPLKIRGTSIATRQQVASRELRTLGMGHRLGELALNLSGGERQRVAIARAVSTNPVLILADEPTGSLDSANSARVIDQLRELHAGGTTVVIITHDRAVAARADRQIELTDGAVTSDTHTTVPPREVVGRTASAADSADAATAGRIRRLGARVVSEIFDAVSTHSANLGRTLLLLVAFMLGVGGLVCAIGISQSAAAQVSNRLTQAGLDEVVVHVRDAGLNLQNFDPSSLAPSGHTVTGLTGVVNAGYVASLQAADARPRLLQDQETTGFDGDILIAGSAYLAVESATTHPSHAARLLDNRWSGAVAVLGRDAAAALGISDVGPGVRLWVADKPVDVVGLIDGTGRNPLLASTIVLSPAAAMGLTPQDPRLVVRTQPGMPAAVADAVPFAVAPATPSSVQVETVADLRQLRHGVSNDFGVLIALVSALLLVLACLTSAVAMYLSVRARASEIALRRAVGASRVSIWRLFTIEGLVVGLGGGIAGAALGLVAVVTVCALQGWTAVLNPQIVAIGIGIGALSGVISAVFPATAAAKNNPALAIRS